MAGSKGKNLLCNAPALIRGGKPFFNILSEVRFRDPVQMDNASKVVKGRFLSEEDFFHHIFLASHQDIIDVLLLLHDGAKHLVQAFVNLENLGKFIQYNDKAFLFPGLLQQTEGIFQDYFFVRRGLQRKFQGLGLRVVGNGWCNSQS